MPHARSTDRYHPVDFSHLFGMKGFSDSLLTNHFKLYEAYVKNTNTLNEQLLELKNQGKMDNPAFGELKRRLGWEYNGMRLHEFYFENLGSSESASRQGILDSGLSESFDSWDKWESEFLGTAMSRGIGWVVLYRDPLSRRLFNCWIDEHNNGHLAGAEPILVLDVWEHAYMTDYGIEKKKYLSNFMVQINWEVVQNRMDARLISNF